MTKQPFSHQVLLVLVIVIFQCVFSPLHAQNRGEFEIDLMKFTQETQKMSQEADKMNMVWWIPVSYWEETFKKDPSMSRKDAHEFIDVIDDYVMIAVVDGTINDYGTASYKSYTTVKKNLHILDKNQKRYFPLSTDKISSEANELLSAFKPFMANMLGNLGQNLHIFLFPNKDMSGVIIDDPKADGSFAVSLGSTVYEWKLPLISLYPVLPCETCKEEFSAAWNYCPWCGSKFENYTWVAAGNE